MHNCYSIYVERKPFFAENVKEEKQPTLTVQHHVVLYCCCWPLEEILHYFSPFYLMANDIPDQFTFLTAAALL